jgi:hypothetical protein
MGAEAKFGVPQSPNHDIALKLPVKQIKDNVEHIHVKTCLVHHYIYVV